MTLAELITWAMQLEDKTLLNAHIYMHTQIVTAVNVNEQVCKTVNCAYVDTDGDIVLTDAEEVESEQANPSEEAT